MLSMSPRPGLSLIALGATIGLLGSFSRAVDGEAVRFSIVDPAVLGDEEPTGRDSHRVLPSHTSLFVISTEGVLYGMGANTHGHLGTNKVLAVPELRRITDNVKSVAGQSHPLIVKRDRSLWTVDRNHVGQLGVGDVEPCSEPTRLVAEDVVKAAAGESHSAFIKQDGSLWVT